MSMAEKQAEFVICLENAGYDDLEVRKIYRTVPDAKAAEVGCVRVIDESGEDYLYPVSLFAPLAIPGEIQERLLATIGKEDGGRSAAS